MLVDEPLEQIKTRDGVVSSNNNSEFKKDKERDKRSSSQYVTINLINSNPISNSNTNLLNTNINTNFISKYSNLNFKEMFQNNSSFKELVGHKKRAYTLNWNISGNKLASGSADNSIRVKIKLKKLKKIKLLK